MPFEIVRITSPRCAWIQTTDRDFEFVGCPICLRYVKTNSFTIRSPFGVSLKMPGITKIPGFDYVIIVEIPSGITVILP